MIIERNVWVLWYFQERTTVDSEEWMVIDSQLLFYLMRAKHQQQLKSEKKKTTTTENPILFHDPCLHARAGNHSPAHATCTLTNICFLFFLLWSNLTNWKYMKNLRGKKKYWKENISFRTIKFPILILRPNWYWSKFVPHLYTNLQARDDELKLVGKKFLLFFLVSISHNQSHRIWV